MEINTASKFWFPKGLNDENNIMLIYNKKLNYK